MSELLYQITAPHFTAGITMRNKPAPSCKSGKCGARNKWIVTDASPIVRWMVGRDGFFIKGYCRTKGWKFARVE